MRNEELSDLIKNADFELARKKLKEEGARLSTPSAANPIFDLLASFVALQSRAKYSYQRSQYKHEGLSDDQKVARENEMLWLFRGMLEAKMDPHMELSYLDSWSREMVSRSVIGVGPIGKEGASTDYRSLTLYARLAGIGWISAMQVLLEKGVAFNAKQIDVAILNVCRLKNQEALSFLLSHHPKQEGRHWLQANDIMESVMKWRGVKPECVADLFNRYGEDFDFDWSRKERIAVSDEKTLIEWLSLSSGEWTRVHRLMLENAHKNSESSTHWMPNLLVPLFNQYVQTGHFENLLQEATQDPLFNYHVDRQRMVGDGPLTSHLVMGAAFNFPSPPDPHRFYYDEEEREKDPLPHERKFAQIRRAVRLYRKLRSLGAPLSVPDFPKWNREESEAMRWSKNGWVPSKATVHRHPELLGLTQNGNSPLHAAKDVETAIAWEGLGVESRSNIEGVDPWVLGMQRASAPVPWAKEIAQRLKDKRLTPHEKGENGESVAAVATKSPPLARAWIKRSKAPPALDMLSGAIKHQQWGLVNEWILEGHFDERPECREVLLKAVLSPPGRTATQTQKNGWDRFLELISCRPNSPWEEQKIAWRNIASKGGISAYAGHMNSQQEKMWSVFAQWGDSARTHWQDSDMRLLAHVVFKNTNNWQSVSPIDLTTDEAVDIAWMILLEKEYPWQDRYDKVYALSQIFEGYLPLSRAGADKFRELQAVNDACENGWREPSDAALKFIQAEELASSTLSPVSSSRSGPGRRL